MTDKLEADYINYSGYMGNPLIKKAGVKIKWTPELVEEYIKCKNDPIYFIETYMKIVHVDRGLIPFKLYDFQKDFVRAMHHDRNILAVWGRQQGKSISVAGFLLHYIIFNDDKTVAILANKESTAIEILGRIELAFMHLPKWLQQGANDFSKKAFALENRSRILAAATSSSAIRGMSASIIYIDELAFIEGWDEFSASVLPTISSGETTKLITTTTPKGLNHVWQIVVDAEEDKNNYTVLQVPWYKVPGRDEVWKKHILQTINNDIEKFRAEYEIEFMGSSGTLIAGWKLKQLKHITPIYNHDGLKVYFKPEENKKYIITADVSEGKGLDNSAFNVIDVTSMPFKQVAIFYSNIVPPEEFAQIIHMTAVNYNNAPVLIEYENLGPVVSYSLFHDFEYENLLCTENAGTLGKRISQKGGSNIDKGIKMSVTVRKTGCSLLKLLIENDKLIINDFDTIYELSRFSKKSNKYQAEPGSHDDLVMSLVSFAWLSNQDYFKDYSDINTISHLREKTKEQLLNEMVPVGFVDRGTAPPPSPEKEAEFNSWLYPEKVDVEWLPNF